MKNNKKLFILLTFIGVFIFIAFISGLNVMAASEEIVEETTWLARLLETYGVPVGISTLIASGGTALGINLITRGFKKQRNTDKEESLKIKNTVDNFLKELKEAEIKNKLIVEKTYNESVNPILIEVRELQKELLETKEAIKKSSLKMIEFVKPREKLIDIEKHEEV